MRRLCKARSITAGSTGACFSGQKLSSDSRGPGTEALLLRSVLGPWIVVFRERVNKLTPVRDILADLTAVTHAKDESEDECL